MAVTCIEGVVSGSHGKQATVRFLVDGGATYTLIPHGDWQAIGLAPTSDPWHRSFIADNSEHGG